MTIALAAIGGGYVHGASWSRIIIHWVDAANAEPVYLGDAIRAAERYS
jgi:hypothetical protein